MSDVRPVRLQLSRKRGFNLQAHSLATNGLPAVNCARPGKWGNPFHIGKDDHGWCVYDTNDQMFARGSNKLGAVHLAVQRFQKNCARQMRDYSSLRGKNLACWCKIGSPCHAETLLELAANAPVCEDA